MDIQRLRDGCIYSVVLYSTSEIGGDLLKPGSLLVDPAIPPRCGGSEPREGLAGSSIRHEWLHG